MWLLVLQLHNTHNSIFTHECLKINFLHALLNFDNNNNNRWWWKGISVVFSFYLVFQFIRLENFKLQFSASYSVWYSVFNIILTVYTLLLLLLVIRCGQDHTSSCLMFIIVMICVCVFQMHDDVRKSVTTTKQTRKLYPNFLGQ